MARCMQFDDQDKEALSKLDNFTISADGETATIEGKMKLEMVRPAFDGGDQFLLGITLPNGDEITTTLLRKRLMILCDIEMENDS